MRRMEAISRKARALRLRHSQSLATQRQWFNQASVLSTATFRQNDEAFDLVRALDGLPLQLCQDSFDRGAECRALVAAIGVKPQQEGVEIEQDAQQPWPPIAAMSWWPCDAMTIRSQAFASAVSISAW